MNNRLKKYNCNDYMFSENSERSFYWAGFFAADGNVSNKGDLNIGVATKDILHLEKFRMMYKRMRQSKLF